MFSPKNHSKEYFTNKTINNDRKSLDDQMNEKKRCKNKQQKLCHFFIATIFLFCYALDQKELQIECRVIIQWAREDHKTKRKKEIQYRFAKSYKNTIFNQTKSSITDYWSALLMILLRSLHLRLYFMILCGFLGAGLWYWVGQFWWLDEFEIFATIWSKFDDLNVKEKT